MRTALGAAMALALCCALPAPATPAPRARGCAMTDPAGDVTFTPGDYAMTADHVDLRSVDVAVTAKTVDVTFHVTANDEMRLGEWRLTFTSGKTSVYVLATRGGWITRIGNDDFPPGFRGGVVGAKPVEGTGSYDAPGLVRVHVPLGAFGKAQPRRGTVLSGFHAKAMEKFYNKQDVSLPWNEIGPVDTASWPYRVTVGGGCRS